MFKPITHAKTQRIYINMTVQTEPRRNKSACAILMTLHCRYKSRVDIALGPG